MVTQYSTGTETLLPCPFCGPGTNVHLVMQHNPQGGWLYEVVCQSCSVTMPCDDSEADAIAEWNLRAPQPVSVAQSSQEPAWSASTHDEIIKRLMARVGMPNSTSLYVAFKQFANELHALAHAAPQPAGNAYGQGGCGTKAREAMELAVNIIHGSLHVATRERNYAKAAEYQSYIDDINAALAGISGIAYTPLTQEKIARALAAVSWHRGGNEHAKTEFVDRRWPHYTMEADAILALSSTDLGCGDPNCKDPKCEYGKGPNTDPLLDSRNPNHGRIGGLYEASEVTSTDRER